MVKFSKQFEAQLVPEWKEAFVDYWKLKKDIKKIQQMQEQQQQQNFQARPPAGASRHGRLTYLLQLVEKQTQHCLHGRTQPDVIQVHRRDSGYETEVVSGRFDETGDAAQTFFSTLDAQLNKINQFYEMKEKEYVDRGEALKEQLRILLDLKAAVKSRNGGEGSSHGGSTSSHSVISLQQREEEESEKAEEEEEEDRGSTERSAIEVAQEDQSTVPEENSKYEKRKGKQLSKLKTGRRTLSSFNSLGKNMRMDIPITNPTRTISAITYLLWEDLVNTPRKDSSSKDQSFSSSSPSITRRQLHHAEKMIRGAFVELYRGIGFLKTYRSLNMLAFVKILKKFDKVTGRQVLPIYLNVVERSYFNSSNKVVKLSDEIKELFTEHFTSANHTKAMKYLKPKQTKESHTITFFIGLFTGCFIALLVGYVIMAQIAGIYTRRRDSTYMETVYPVFSLLALLNLHIFLYGCNIFLWRKHRINHVFIFEFSRKKELKYQDVFLICTAFMTAVVGCMLGHLALRAKGFSYFNVDTIPGFLLLIVTLALINPFNIMYRSTRYSFLRVLRNIILSPLYKVVMVDFFMADQLTSQVPLLRQLEYITCYYVTASFKTQNFNSCTINKQYRDLAYLVSFLPYYWRAMQCARRWFDEGHMHHIANLGKYVSAMVAAGARLTYEKQQNMVWIYMVVITSAIATVYQLYWDFVRDWGLLRPGSKNPWLRDELILKHKFIYFLSMALNFVLRLVWLQTVLHSSFESVDQRIMGLFLASLEVIRRGHWNFYRLENEHLTNAGRFRAIKTVPLPFHEADDD